MAESAGLDRCVIIYLKNSAREKGLYNMDKSVIAQKISKIKKLAFKDSEIIHVSYENGGSIKIADNQIIDGLPDFYRVVIKSQPGKGSLIISELWLPEEWNGIFTGLGNGGMAGQITYWALADMVKQGYAAANTDMGTSRGRSSGIDNRDVWKDFGWRATHIMTEVSKKLILAHYGAGEKYSYFLGGSTGGQQAFAEAQRYPEDYNGILAGVPANNRTNLHTYFLWNHNHLRSKDGKSMFTDAEIEKITGTAVEFFQLNGDGEKGDNFITQSYTDERTVDGFLEFLSGRAHFSQEQIKALRAVYLGPKNPKTGKRIYNGMPLGSEKYGCGIRDCQNAESPHFYPFVWAFGDDYSGYDFDFDKDLEKLNLLLSEDLNANEPDLSAFFEHGGKIIAYSGSADPCVPYPDAMNYYNRVMKCMGGYGNVSEFFRYFLMPGKDHGKSGDGTNALLMDTKLRKDAFDALRMWCEQSIAPDALVAAKVAADNVILLSRTVYPYGSENNSKKEFLRCCEII